MKAEHLAAAAAEMWRRIRGGMREDVARAETAVMAVEASLENAAQLARIATALERIADSIGNLDVTAHNHSMGSLNR